uniref:Myotubularin-related protein 10-B n=3 Tax=Culex pipiens TaxID=7175 RepID=A0A8D8FN09_CULPI
MSELCPSQKQNFTSYVKEDFDEQHSSSQYEMKFVPGEIEVARVNNVNFFTTQCTKENKNMDEKQGALVITNFRICFLCKEFEQEETTANQKNMFLGKYDVSLSNVDKIVQLTDKKQRAVNPQIKNSSKIETIKIVCKNFRYFTLGFKNAGIGKGKYIADALVKFAFPTKHNLLFLYNYKEKYYSSIRYVSMFDNKCDWIKEVKRCGSESGWRVLTRDRMEIDSSLPMHYVVPRHLSDVEYVNISKSFRNGRSAIWVWSVGNANLVRMAELKPEIASPTIENTLLEHVRKCDPSKRAPHLMELSKLLPRIQEVNFAYLKLRKLCTPETDSDFMAQDSRFQTLLEKTYWLLYVSVCLKQSVEAAKLLMVGQTVVLQELNGRDMSCVISSLVQLLLDSSFRTINGFQTLIQKEWISLGHPFSDRIGHVCGNADEQSPLFILFLDCVWQLLNQFPEKFEFSETFLTSLWDSVFLPIFDTFQFNCETERQIAQLNDRIVLRPVWDWGEQFSDKDIALFTNPLYRKNALDNLNIYNRTTLQNDVTENKNVGDIIKEINKPAPDIPMISFIEPSCALKDIEIWQQCYFRWIPFLEIQNGGFPHIDLFNRSVQNNIILLQKLLIGGNISSSEEKLLPSKEFALNSKNKIEANDGSGIDESKIQFINSFFPFTSNAMYTDFLDILFTNEDILCDGSIIDSTSLS